MISQKKIDEVAELLISSGWARKVILFGSYARGDAQEGSDIDFLVVENKIDSKVQEIIRLRRLIRPLGLPVDIVVASELDIKEWGEIPGTALYWALKEGRVLKSAAS